MPISNEHEASIFAAELGECPKIDLHGLRVEDAKRALDEFLNRQFMEGAEVIKIIHGRGTERLRKAVESMLRSHPLVEYSRGSNAPNQTNAVTFAALAKK